MATTPKKYLHWQMDLSSSVIKSSSKNLYCSSPPLLRLPRTNHGNADNIRCSGGRKPSHLFEIIRGLLMVSSVSCRIISIEGLNPRQQPLEIRQRLWWEAEVFLSMAFNLVIPVNIPIFVVFQMTHPSEAAMAILKFSSSTSWWAWDS